MTFKPHCLLPVFAIILSGCSGASSAGNGSKWVTVFELAIGTDKAEEFDVKSLPAQIVPKFQDRPAIFVLTAPGEIVGQTVQLGDKGGGNAGLKLTVTGHYKITGVSDKTPLLVQEK